MKNITNLIEDIYSTIKRKDAWFTNELADDLGREVSTRIHQHYQPREGKGTLRLSKMRDECPRALWYSVNHPDMGEELPAPAKLKYSYGHIIEAQTISLCKAAGHEVTGEQDELVVDGIKGHRDCVIDGCIVDVKSSSTPGFSKFREGTLAQGDTFGYLDQLDGYLVGSASDPLVRCKDRGYILAIDKTLGHMCLYEHGLTDERELRLRDRIRYYKELVSRTVPPECTCKTVKDGESGNFRLDLKASYSPYKYCCRPDVRTFIYADGPRYLTVVAKRPASHIVELDAVGRRVS